MKRSILLVNPAYHYSFFLKDNLRNLGWRADVFKDHAYPAHLLYRDDCVSPRHSNNPVLNSLFAFAFFLHACCRYKFFLVYGCADFMSINLPSSVLKAVEKTFKQPFSVNLALLKLLNRRLICFPNGCLQEVLKSDFQQHEGGEVCANCGWPSTVCNDKANQKFFDLINKYYDYVIANTPVPSVRVKKHLIRERTLDLDIYRPNLTVPKVHRLPMTSNLRILHSFSSDGRQHGGRNIKGSHHIVNAVNRLKAEGYPVEYMYLSRVHAREMRFYQAQADIVVDQLIYGWWGSTAIECMALGKPVVCHITPAWKSIFLDMFPEYTDLPLVEANRDSIYGVLKKLVTNKDYREQKAHESRRFAEQHFDATRNASEFVEIFLGVDRRARACAKQQRRQMSFTEHARQVSSLVKKLFAVFLDVFVLWYHRFRVRHRFNNDALLAERLFHVKNSREFKLAHRVALYGAGQHTYRLLRLDILPKHKLCAVFDDHTNDTLLSTLPVYHPREAQNVDFSMLLISSDIHEETLLKRARKWLPENKVAMCLYCKNERCVYEC